MIFRGVQIYQYFGTIRNGLLQSGHCTNEALLILASDDSKAMIKLQRVSFSYPNQKSFQFNFEVQKGEKLWIYGPSGVGKTTLFKLILGFISPEGGGVFINGEQLSTVNVFKLRQEMSYVPQHSSLGRAKVWDIFQEIFSFKANRHLKPERTEVLQLFEEFGLEEKLLDQSFEQLSGGEQQRVSIALALLLKREIMLLDEAVSAIDQTQRKKILQYLAQTEHSILLIAHDPPGVGQFRERGFNQIKTN